MYNVHLYVEIASVQPGYTCIYKKVGDILANAKIIKSNRQPKNLKQILTKAKFEDDTRDEAPKVLKCKNTKCGICEKRKYY